jgi:hypothetical protein
MALYPSTLFHFTDSFNNLKGILINAFIPAYARETIKWEDNGGGFMSDYAVPMVSFCDLRVSELNSHIKNYGSFGIGLTKEWAKKKEIHPVFYINEKNSLIPDYFKTIKSDFERAKISTNLDDHHRYNIYFRLHSFLKHYQGDLMRKGKVTIKDYFFADEREWRYVPKFTNAEFALSYIGGDKFKKKDWKKTNNAKIPINYKLHFDPDDIKYLIVKKEEDILKLIEHLKLKGSIFNQKPDTIAKLSSRILTCEQIEKDI